MMLKWGVRRCKRRASLFVQGANMTPSKLLYHLIPLTQGQWAIVDTTDYDWLMQWKWFANYNRCTKSYYAGRQTPRGDSSRQVSVWMHREILSLPRRSDGRLGDHINHMTLDNRRENLRIVTRAQNSQNHRLRADSPSGSTGVSFYAPLNKWRSRIRFGGHETHLGYYDTFGDAVEAYRKRAAALYGEFAPKV
jgi:hypothetical protein